MLESFYIFEFYLFLYLWTFLLDSDILIIK
nr:MAG TPA: hypothetical protein [Caudoviricetes sp.]